MTALEIKSIDGLAGSDIHYAYAVKAGPWVFLNGHEAFDFATGSDAAVAGPPGFPSWGQHRYRREGDYILARLQKTLRELGADLNTCVRLDQYYPTVKAVDPYHLARKATFKDYIPPSTSVIMERGLHARSAICTSVIAIVPSDDYRISRVHPKGVLAPETSAFVPAITCNDFVFVAGQMATSDEGGLDPRAHAPDFDRWGGSEIRKQTEFIITKKLKAALEAADSGLEHALKAQVYIDSVEHIPDFLDVWNAHVGDSPCALSVIPTKNFSTVGGLLEINIFALRAGAKRKKEVIDAGLPGMAAYGPCIRAGDLLLPSGLMAVDADGNVAGCADAAALTPVSHAGARQAHRIYDYLEALCAKAGTSTENIMRALYFVSAPDEFSGVTSAWAARYGSRPHPLAYIQTPTPPAPHGAVVTGDFWVYVP